MPRRTISVGAKTWEALSALGRFGQSYDDVIQTLLQEHEELKQLKSQLSQSQPQQQPQPHQPQSPQDYVTEDMMEGKEHFQPRQHLKEKQQHQSQSQPQLRQPEHIRTFERDIVKPKPGERSVPGEKSIEVELDLPGIKFPINKNELTTFAKRLDKIFEYDTMAVGGFYNDLFTDLPDKTYANISSLRNALVATLNNTRRDFFGENRRVMDIKIVTTKEEMDKRLQEIAR